MSITPFTLLNTPLVGLEDLQRAAFYVFFEGMNNAIDEISDYWIPRDQEFDQLTGSSFSPIALEHISNENFHEGHKPSLLRGSPENYPNLTVFATQADPSAENSRFDQIDSWLNSLLVEVMVKAPAPNPQDQSSETICNRRIQRTAEAVVLCLRRNQNLGGANYGLNQWPSILISDISAVRSPSQGGAYPGQQGSSGARTGERYVWQGAAIRFRIQKDAIPALSGAGTFAESSQIDYSKYIDQG